LPIDAPTDARKVFGRDATHVDWVGLIEPQFAADPDTVYFMRWFGNGYELYSLSLRSSRVKRVARSVREFWIVCRGPFKNDVVVEEDQLKLAGGHTNLYWLYDDKGTRQDLVGTSIEDVKLFFGGKLPHRD
jgi:hypothetical protein